MDEVIKRFLTVSYGYGNGDGNGDGDGDGDGDGNGYGNDNDYGNGYGNGYGYGYGDGYGNGYGDGNGDGDGDGYGNGSGDGNGIQEIDGHRVYLVDNVPTIILSVHGNYAKGYTLYHNVNLQPCYIARVGNHFAHGQTLSDANRDALRKYNNAMPLEEKIKQTIAKYPTLNTIVPNAELFDLHHLLTGSCQYGREQFCDAHGISLEGSMTMREFIEVTRNDYGGDKIDKLYNTYPH